MTYGQNGNVIKQEVFALGTLVLKYVRKKDLDNEVEGIEIVDKESLKHLPEAAYDKLQSYMTENPEWFKK